MKDHRDVAEPDPQPYTLAKAIDCKSMHLLPGYENRSLTLMEKLHSVRSKNLPAAFFQLDLRIPRVAVMGWGLPMFLTLDHDLARSTNEKAPTVYLKQVKVSLETLGTIRCLNDGVLRLKTEDKVEAYEQRIIIGEFNGAKNPQPITERIDLRKLMNLHLDPQFISPRFSTFNLEVHHALKIKVVVECARKTFMPEWFRRDLEILPELYQAPTVPAGNMSITNSVPIHGQPYAAVTQEATIPPPPYEAATSVEGKLGRSTLDPAVP